MQKRAGVLIAAGALIAGAVTAAPTSAAPPTAEPPRLAWEKCGTKQFPKLECASLPVPLDHDDPDGERITLALSRIPHTAATPRRAALVNPGGPGASGRTLAGYVAATLPPALAAQYDVIGFDPRGVGRSRPALDCLPGHFAPVRHASVPRDAAEERKGAAAPPPSPGRAATGTGRCCRTSTRSAPPATWTRSAPPSAPPHHLPRLLVRHVPRGRVREAVPAPRAAGRPGLGRPPGGRLVRREPGAGPRIRRPPQGVRCVGGPARQGCTGSARTRRRWRPAGTRCGSALREEPAGGKVGAAELEDTYLPGGYHNGFWPTGRGLLRVRERRGRSPAGRGVRGGGGAGRGHRKRLLGVHGRGVPRRPLAQDVGHLAPGHLGDAREGAVLDLEQRLVQRAVRVLAGGLAHTGGCGQRRGAAGAAGAGDGGRGHTVRGSGRPAPSDGGCAARGGAGRRQPRRQPARQRLRGPAPGPVPGERGAPAAAEGAEADAVCAAARTRGPRRSPAPRRLPGRSAPRPVPAGASLPCSPAFDAPRGAAGRTARCCGGAAGPLRPPS